MVTKKRKPVPETKEVRMVEERKACCAFWGDGPDPSNSVSDDDPELTVALTDMEMEELEEAGIVHFGEEVS